MAFNQSDQFFEPSTDTNANFGNSVSGQTNSFFLPKVYSGDHLYFPNQSFSGKENSFLWIDCDDMQRTYKAFSLGVKTIKTDEINEMKHFFLIHDRTEQDSLNGIIAERTDFKRRMSVNQHSKFFADEIQMKGKLPE